MKSAKLSDPDVLWYSHTWLAVAVCALMFDMCAFCAFTVRFTSVLLCWKRFQSYYQNSACAVCIAVIPQSPLSSLFPPRALSAALMQGRTRRKARRWVRLRSETAETELKIVILMVFDLFTARCFPARGIVRSGSRFTDSCQTLSLQKIQSEVKAWREFSAIILFESPFNVVALLLSSAIRLLFLKCSDQS